MGHCKYAKADELDLSVILAKWKWVRRTWLHLEDGFTLIASQTDEIVGFISVRWMELPEPLNGIKEGFVDIIEVEAHARRRGIGTRLIQISEMECRAHHARQLRGWSSEDKKEAIPMWLSLGFGLCPATDYPNNQAIRGYFVAKPLPKD
jgi:GNAT superfamily N-acetyltransferase